jgi:Tat protein secretion system quality control protein TatD with DNase activity
MKHIEIHYHLVREKIEESFVKLVYCNTKNMVINILIKGISIDKHEYFWHLMGVIKWVTW